MGPYVGVDSNLTVESKSTPYYHLSIKGQGRDDVGQIRLDTFATLNDIGYNKKI